MTSARTRHNRKARRQKNMHQRSGGKFKVGHKGRSGRTGSMHAKKLAARRPK